MGAVLKLWHDAREAAGSNPETAIIPSEADLQAASEHTNIDNIIINTDECTVYISDPMLSIDVGAIGKGYVAEIAAQLLISRNATSYVINLGGNIRTIGEKTNGNGWEAGITNPDKTSDEPFVCKVNIPLFVQLLWNRDTIHRIIEDETMFRCTFKFFNTT